MTDYSDWEGWVDEALFDCAVRLRRSEWLENAAAREALKQRLRDVATYAETLDDYAPRPTS